MSQLLCIPHLERCSCCACDFGSEAGVHPLGSKGARIAGVVVVEVVVVVVAAGGVSVGGSVLVHGRC